MTVTTQCADNAHVRTGNNQINVTCVSNGSWSNNVPQCECDLNYTEAIVNGRQTCIGEITHLECIIFL